MANTILNHGVPAPHTKLIMCNGEILTPEVRKRIQQAFQCPVVDSYGAAEVFRIAIECRNQQFHILPDSAIVEIDETTRNSDGSAEILVTPLYLRTMPLIRYRLGDRITLSAERCSCGSSWPVIAKVLGRSDDLLTLPSGRRISPRALNTLDHVEGLKEYQIIQKRPSVFDVHVRPSPGFSEGSRAEIERAIITGCAPDRVSVRVIVADTLRRAQTGKLNAVTSEVD
jgi:phenylacetate-CoA ligase